MIVYYMYSTPRAYLPAEDGFSGEKRRRIPARFPRDTGRSFHKSVQKSEQLDRKTGILSTICGAFRFIPLLLRLCYKLVLPIDFPSRIC